jgi:hypothetical protein
VERERPLTQLGRHFIAKITVFLGKRKRKKTDEYRSKKWEIRGVGSAPLVYNPRS